jgi:hypothetical protein
MIAMKGRVVAVIAALLLAVVAASACKRSGPGAKAGTAARKTATPTPGVRFTPMPDPPTPTVKPGQPTPPPDLPR